jgi:hypothetical protein
VSWRWPSSLEAKNDTGDLIAVKIPVGQIERIKGLGYTDSEAHFLYIVAVHSGYFTLRQFCTFTHAARGKRSFLFARKLLQSEHASIRDYPGVGPVFHLFSRTVYGQMEKDNLRNRRRHSFEFIRTHLLLLDFILANQILAYFETEQDKVRFFCETMGMSKDCLPAKIYEGRQGSQPTVRYFVDKFPLFLAPPVSGAPPVVTFSYVDSGLKTPSGFLTHLVAYQRIFRQLATFRFLYIAAKDAYFQMAEQGFRSLVKRPLESDTSAEILRYFHIRKKWENHEYVVPVTADFEFLTDARQRFHGHRFEGLYNAWRSGELLERELRVEFSQLGPERTVFFETCLVRRHGRPYDLRGKEGERSVKDNDHHPVHRPVHPSGDRKLLGA